MTPPKKYRQPASAGAALTALEKFRDAYVAMDFETTALHPRHGEVRIVTLANDRARVLIDLWTCGTRLLDVIAALGAIGARAVVFNSKFEQRWIDASLTTQGRATRRAAKRLIEQAQQLRLIDVKYLRDAMEGGANLSLALMAKWDLDIDLPKDEQTSDWAAGRLTRAQLDYAMRDSDVTWALWKKRWEVADEGQLRCMALLNDQVPAVIEMEDTGMRLDQERHAAMIAHWEELAVKYEARLREMLPVSEVANLGSDKQLSDYFARLLPDALLSLWPRTPKSGQLQMDGDTLQAIAAAVHGTPLQAFLDALRDHKSIRKYISSFGHTLITSAQLTDGRIRCRFNVAAAKTCRYSSSGPNLQQVPRDKSEFHGEVMSLRQSFLAEPGKHLVSYDYSGIELRVLALIAQDEQLLQDVVEGDVHAEVAAFMAGRPIDKNVPADKELRSAAKAVSFGIIYGSGPSGLAATMRVSIPRAIELIDFWEDRYPAAFRLRHHVESEATQHQRIRCVDGGTIYMGKRPELPKCANYPVQRGAFSVMARAIKRHHDTLQAKRRRYKGWRGVRMCATIHDQLIDEAPTGTAKSVAKALERDMTAAYLDIFPGAPTGRLIEGGIGPNWGELG